LDSKKDAPSAAPIAGSRRLAREAALQILYLMDTCERGIEDLPDRAWSEEPLAPKTRAFAEHIVNGVNSHRETLDAIIRKYAQNWEMGRMAAIDRCILRMSAFELLHEVDTPVSVAINEAVEIAKKYSTAESSKFVNGILDKVKEERSNGGEAASK
jgi:N utilization substance protein B